MRGKRETKSRRTSPDKLRYEMTAKRGEGKKHEMGGGGEGGMGNGEGFGEGEGK